MHPRPGRALHTESMRPIQAVHNKAQQPRFSWFVRLCWVILGLTNTSSFGDSQDATPCQTSDFFVKSQAMRLSSNLDGNSQALLQTPTANFRVPASPESPTGTLAGNVRPAFQIPGLNSLLDHPPQFSEKILHGVQRSSQQHTGPDIHRPAFEQLRQFTVRSEKGKSAPNSTNSYADAAFGLFNTDIVQRHSPERWYILFCALFSSLPPSLTSPIPEPTPPHSHRHIDRFCATERAESPGGRGNTVAAVGIQRRHAELKSGPCRAGLRPCLARLRSNPPLPSLRRATRRRPAAHRPPGRAACRAQPPASISSKSPTRTGRAPPRPRRSSRPSSRDRPRVACCGRGCPPRSRWGAPRAGARRRSRPARAAAVGTGPTGRPSTAHGGRRSTCGSWRACGGAVGGDGRTSPTSTWVRGPASRWPGGFGCGAQCGEDRRAGGLWGAAASLARAAPVRPRTGPASKWRPDGSSPACPCGGGGGARARACLGRGGRSRQAVGRVAAPASLPCRPLLTLCGPPRPPPPAPSPSPFGEDAPLLSASMPARLIPGFSGVSPFPPTTVPGGPRAILPGAARLGLR
jgi:hypothetical protein